MPREVEWENSRGGEGVGEGLVRIDRLAGETLRLPDTRRGWGNGAEVVSDRLEEIVLGDGVPVSEPPITAEGPDRKGDRET